MGQKTDPRGFRLALTKNWSSRWFCDSKNFAKTLLNDIKIRKYLTGKFGRSAFIARVLIERSTKKINITIYTARPGVVIGKKGEGIDTLKQQILSFLPTDTEINFNVEEIRKPELNAEIVASQVAHQIEKRIAFRRAMKRAMQSTMKLGADGVKIEVSGRLNGAEIARSEWYREGRVPLHTLKADIDYATNQAITTYGVTGVKVWIYKGIAKNNQQSSVRPLNGDDDKYKDRKNLVNTKKRKVA
jgi:small subunit ribosomal protein S3